jgi:hypothetical protein
LSKTLKPYQLIIWILFVYVLISAATTITKALIYLFFHYGLNNGFIEIHFRYYLPLFGFSITIICSVIVFTILRRYLLRWQWDNSKPPIVLFLLFFLISITDPLLKKTSDKSFHSLFDDLSKTDYLSERNFDTIFSSLEFCLFGIQWVLIALLLFFSLYLLKVNKY